MAVCVILDLYRQRRSVVLEYLPPDDSISRKNILFKTIFEGFAEIDGRPTDAEIRVGDWGVRSGPAEEDRAVRRGVQKPAPGLVPPCARQAFPPGETVAQAPASGPPGEALTSPGS